MKLFEWHAVVLHVIQRGQNYALYFVTSPCCVD